MIEKAYRFGKGECLVGIITEPDACTRNVSLPAVLLLNSGLVHRVGPFRLYVEIARRLTSLGFMVFRFDLSGVGDSKAPRGSQSYDERAVSDVQEAMNMLATKKGVHEFVLMGICSGARLAHQVAVADLRVSGNVVSDGYAYPTWGFYLRYYGPRVRSLSKWRDFLKRRFASVFAKAHDGAVGTELVEELLLVEFPPKAKIRADLVGLIDRGVNLLVIHSGGWDDYYNYRDQFQDAFRSVDFQGKLQLEYFNEATHTFTLLEDRDQLVATICKWMQANYQCGITDRVIQSDKKGTELTKTERRVAPL